MPEYIERDIVLEALEKPAEYYAAHDECTEHAIKQCMSTIRKIPAADVAPVRQWRRLWADDGYLRCSNCHQKAPQFEHEAALAV